MTYDIPYTPPEPMFQDTLLAFQAFSGGPHIGARIAPDPFGPVNKIVSLVVDGRVVKSVLARVPVGAKVELGQGFVPVGEVKVQWPGNLWSSAWPDAADGWYIEVDGHTVLYATEAEVDPPSTWTPPRIPLWRRMTQAAHEQRRADADWIAGRFGYHHEDNCERSDW